jgi:hypothetical protein
MIANAAQLYAALHQLSSMADMLEALRLDCQAKNDYSLFPLISEGYLNRIRELNADIRDYLRAHPEPELASSNSAV